MGWGPRMGADGFAFWLHGFVWGGWQWPGGSGPQCLIRVAEAPEWVLDGQVPQKEGQAAPWSGCMGWGVGVLLSGAPAPRPCREAGKTRDAASIHRCWPQGWAPRWPRSRGGGPGAGSALAALAPGSHRGGAWLGARVWFEISATSPGLPRDLAERTRDKHWKVGRAS